MISLIQSNGQSRGGKGFIFADDFRLKDTQDLTSPKPMQQYLL